MQKKWKEGQVGEGEMRGDWELNPRNKRKGDCDTEEPIDS
jgi:hypothetical protein